MTSPFKSAHHFPFFINNFNRLECLKKLLAWLQTAGFQNIFILDNQSTYEPLLDFYRTTPHRVIYLRENLGYLALWKTELFNSFNHDYYFYSDPDILPCESCPPHVAEFLHESLLRHPAAEKIGLGLKVDDLPAHFALRDQVRAHEAPFWRRPVGRHLYWAPVDTTFALYRPGSRGGWWLPAHRTAAPYLARHLPWYSDPQQLSAEDIFYRDSVQTISAHWTPKIV